MYFNENYVLQTENKFYKARIIRISYLGGFHEQDEKLISVIGLLLFLHETERKINGRRKSKRAIFAKSRSLISRLESSSIEKAMPFERGEYYADSTQIHSKSMIEAHQEEDHGDLQTKTMMIREKISEEKEEEAEEEEEEEEDDSKWKRESSQVASSSRNNTVPTDDSCKTITSITPIELYPKINIHQRFEMLSMFVLFKS
ncbi:hypothetical protein V1478_018306 [Vespula squamosa]|uniref:Uncharacterized protein n=1 Tax=Vespula squamosa TaxID=30214 RepID=A0ABD1ZV37_VESSQ